ncbi:L-aspartate oxidase [Weeksella virosa]|uniref:L-aspartate oxidase n=1 Tax=Weeksella virosa (strain ATCC 43766 / DSM 16922 / JCM 21250 / CCUG 30538 / CDC 9751 / IAM 14551 / NBRC 16016 / NCTC 11634 / CL345/78) TaxID=865938 RepID=F0P1A2_WEEVC|nr:L-aspartate oxidase [Weeksella virosa]ADX67601.1 L-aspartate oxidase [Weeksella virosa DSM 16922]VEH64775.1 L-aspartate oxidase [Weeksella virosa]
MYDVLVIGSGISGLSFALKIAQQKKDIKVKIITKANKDESNTKYAQGGVAVVTDFVNDSFRKHIHDTLQAGDGICNQQAVQTVITEGPARFIELQAWGTQFDTSQEGTLDLGREGGHTENRIVHYKDSTGAEIERSLLANILKFPNIEIQQHMFAVDLLMNEKVCFGAKVFNLLNQKKENIFARYTLLATGGCGQIYQNSTNPTIATGDGIALAKRANAEIKAMQFIQFHPTAFYRKQEGQLFLISEAVRGFGAKLLNAKKEAFMARYDERAELASRDIVARAIDEEIKKTQQEYVWLDCRHLDKKSLIDHFPNIYRHCLENGFDLSTDLIPVAPAAHYLCGGIAVDLDGKTSLENLFAVGECSNTGLHGANRLASNSLLEAMVFGHRAAEKTFKLLSSSVSHPTEKPFLETKSKKNLSNKTERTNLLQLRTNLQRMMSKRVGIVRNFQDLRIAMEELNEMKTTFDSLWEEIDLGREVLEIRNMLDVAELVISQSLEQKENKGTYYNKDLDV